MDPSLQEVKSTFEEIEDDWPELLDEDFNALDLALRLLDTSSVGEAGKMQKYKELKDKFSDSLKKAVNSHYMSFNDAIGSYGIAVESLSESQDTLGKIRADLQNVSQYSSTGSRLLTELSVKQRQCDETIETLEKIGQIRDNKAKIDAAILDRKYEEAQKLIQDSTKTAQEHALWQLPALQSTQQSLDGQRQTLFDTLVDDMDGTIYLKPTEEPGSSSYDEQMQSKLFSMATTDVEDVSCAINSPLSQFISEKSAEGGLKEGVAPGSDTRSFRGLDKSLRLLGALDKEQDALQILSDRSAADFRRMVRQTAVEVRSKYPGSTVQQITSGAGANTGGDDWAALMNVNGDVIREFFSHLFRKSIFILQLHRAVDVIAQSHGLQYNFSGVWDEMQKQLGSIIYNYIVDEKLLNEGNVPEDSDTPFQKPLLADSADIPILQFAKFSLSDDGTTSKSADELRSVLKEMFPGQTVGSAGQDESLYIEDDNDATSQNERTLLVKPNAFNMSAIIENLLLFVGSASQVFPEQQQRVPLRWFSHFMQYFFRAQLEATLTYQFERASKKDGDDDLQQFFNSVLQVLDTSLYYRQPYVEIIIGLLQKMAEKYASEIREVVPPELLRTGTGLYGSWLRDNELKDASVQVMQSPSAEQRLNMAQKELQLSLKNGNKTLELVQVRDFLDSAQFNQLSALLKKLLLTLQWLPALKREVKPLDGSSDANDQSSLDSLRETWHFGESSSSSRPLLALRGKSIEQFDHIVDSLRRMANTIKLYLRYDLRAKAIYTIGTMLSKDMWMPEYETEEIDPEVLKFNKAITESSRVLQESLKNCGGNDERTQIFSYLPDLIDQLLVGESRRIIKINGNGVYRVFVNVRVLQQMLRNVLDPKDVNFANTWGYYGLFKATEKGIVDAIKQSIQSETYSYTPDDYRNMVRLVFSESMDRDMKKKRTSSYSASKRYADTLKRLNEELK